MWSGTELAAKRTTSAIELYGQTAGSSAALLSICRNTPRVGTSRQGVHWELPLDEVLRFGSSATTGSCERAGAFAIRAVASGAIVVRAVLDYRTLPFIESQSPYLESLQPERPGRSTRSVRARRRIRVLWVEPCADCLVGHERLARSPMRVSTAGSVEEAVLGNDRSRNGTSFRVYFINDRGAVYALGYPSVTAFRHLINLAELMFLAGTVYVALLALDLAATSSARGRPPSGRALLREIRASFYKRLLLVFVAVAVVPVVILAIATSTYLATQLNAGVAETAAKTALGGAAPGRGLRRLQQPAPNALGSLDDQIMDLVRRAIDEDVNLFARAQLQATSERPLFASRTPSDTHAWAMSTEASCWTGRQPSSAKKRWVMSRTCSPPLRYERVHAKAS